MSQLRYYLLITAVILASFVILPVMAKEPELPDNWYELAQSLEKEKKNDEAIDLYDQAISAFPDDDNAARKKGMFLKRIGQYTDALKAFEKAREINADNALTWQNIGALLARIGRYDEAIEAFNKVLTMDAGWMDTYVDIGIVLDKQEKYEEAIEMFDKVLSKDPDDYKIYALKGDTLIHLGEYEKALETYEEGVSVLQKSGCPEINEYADDLWGDNVVGLVEGGGFIL